MATSESRKETSRSACDRCYELKERCTRPSITVVCRRCNRLDLVCSTVRPKRPAGPRPHRGKQSVVGATLCSSGTLDVGAWLQESPDLLLEERELLVFLLDRPEILDYYVVTTSFRGAEQQSFMAPFLAALPVLKDAYLACAGALKSLEPGVAADQQTVNLRHASSATEILRSLSIVNSQDAALCLALGTTLTLAVYGAVGIGVADICRYCLSATTPVMETVSDADTEPSQSFLVLLETLECVIHRRRPTIRIRPWASQNVDRHLGLSLPLLPYYYDLCVSSYSLVDITNASYPACLQKRLDEIQHAVESWQPSYPNGFRRAVRIRRNSNLLAHATDFRLGGLLLIHLLRHAFGRQDSQADIWAKEIMMELELARQVTKRPTRCVTLPFIAAAIDMRDPGARVKALWDVDNYVNQIYPGHPKVCTNILAKSPAGARFRNYNMLV